MSQTVQDALANGTLYTDEYNYIFLKLPPNAITMAAGVVAETGMPFCGLIVDKDEVTLMLPNEAYEEFENRLKYAKVSAIRYRLITFDIELEPTLVGFMAHISRALAEANISIMPFAAYSRDHIFVASEQFDSAMTILRSLR